MTHSNWMDRHPWWGRLAFLGLGVFASFFVRSGLENARIKEGARQEVHRAWSLIPRGAPSKTERAGSAPDCVTVTPPAE